MSRASEGGVLVLRRCCGIGVVIVAVFGFCSAGTSARVLGQLSWRAPAMIDPGVAPPGGNHLGVACPSAALCVVADWAGNVVTSIKPAAGAAAWQFAHIDDHAACQAGCSPAFRGVSCPSAALCVALDDAGYIFTSRNPAAGAAAWSSSGPLTEQRLSTLACPSVSLCVAGAYSVGSCNYPPACSSGAVLTTTTPDGSAASWHAATIDTIHCDPSEQCQGPLISAIACPSISLCVAGDEQGDIFVSTDPTGGTDAWRLAYVDPSRIGVPISSMTERAGISAIACASLTLCVASDWAGNVITTRNPTGGASAWALKHVFDTGDPFGTFSELACPSESRCVGVSGGQAEVSDNAFDGGAWTSVKIDAKSGPRGFASSTGLACPSVVLCVVVDNGGNAIVGRAALLSTHQIRSLVARQISPRGERARIRALLRHKGFPLEFKAPMLGRLTVNWIASATHTRRLIATGHQRFTSPDKEEIRLTLTRGGRKLLRHARRLKLTIQATFTPAGHRPIRATKRIALRR